MYKLLLYVGGGVVGLLTLTVLLRKFRFRKPCPSCGYDDPDRIPRKGLMKRLPLKAYYCPACRHRFYVVNLFSEEPEIHTLPEWKKTPTAFQMQNDASNHHLVQETK